MYWSFNTRRIIDECIICKKRISGEIVRNFDSPFPIPTDSINYNDFNLIASGLPYERIESIVYVKDEYK